MTCPKYPFYESNYTGYPYLLFTYLLWTEMAEAEQEDYIEIPASDLYAQT